MTEKEIVFVLVKKFLFAMNEYNYMVVNGTFSQWQVALAKYETLRDSLTAIGYPPIVKVSLVSVYGTERQVYSSVVVDGKMYRVGGFNDTSKA